jgi:hypothetical protein
MPIKNKKKKKNKNPWNFDTVPPAVVLEDKQDDSDDKSSVDSTVTFLDADETDKEILLATSVVPPLVTPDSPPRCATRLVDLALLETPEHKQSKQRKAPDDWHVLIHWSELQKLVKECFSCAGCGGRVTNFNRRTIGIATELDLYCQSCKMTGTAEAIRSNYYTKQNKSNKDFIQQRRIDNYELNWRLVRATQLLGELQVGGAIIGLFLDLSRDTFWNSWLPMEEEALHVLHRRHDRCWMSVLATRFAVFVPSFPCPL